MEKICMCCGGTFHVPPSRFDVKKFCSSECRKKYREENLHITLKCDYCGKEFDAYSKDLKYGRRYCSKECSDLAKQHVLTLTCGHCGKEFTRRSRATTNPDNAFCSKKCRDAHKRLAEMTKCEVCGKEFYRSPAFLAGSEHHFCSEACKGVWMSGRRRGEDSPVYNSRACKCLVCGKEFVQPVSRVEVGKGKFCSRECKYKFFSEHFKETRNPNWHGGAKDYRGPDWAKIRLAVIERDGYRCAECGSNEAPLHVHHIKPYRYFKGDYEKANNPSNLVTLCTKCHSKKKIHHMHRRKSFHGNAVVNTGLTACVTVESRG